MSSGVKQWLATVVVAGLCGPVRSEPAWPTNGVLTFGDAVDIALADSPTVAAAEARVSQGRARLMQARAAYWPALSGSLGYAQVEQAESRTVEIPGVVTDGDRYRASLDAQWLLFDRFARRATARAAGIGAEQSVEALRDARRRLTLATASTYFAAQLARENVAIARADEAFNQRQLEDARAREQAGAGTLSDSLNFAIRVNEAKAAVIDAQRSQAIARTGLAALMGLPDAALPDDVAVAALAAVREPEMQAPDEAGLVSLAVDVRPDVEAAGLARARARAAADAVRGDFWPWLALSGSYDGDRPDDPGFASEDFGYTVGLALTYTFSDGGRRRGRLRESEAAVQEAESIVAEARINARSEVRQAAAGVRRAQQQLALQRENTALVERTRDLVETEYAAGEASLVRLNEAQRDLVAARSRLAVARVALRTAWVELRGAAGTILDTYAGSQRSAP